jgi:5-methylcytosine-specific restriction endonuclease McrA
LRRTPLKRSQGIKRASTRTKAKGKQRKALREDFLVAYPYCERCGGVATDVHEVIRRSQAKDAELRWDLFVALCRRCHSWATDNPQAGHDAGYVLWSWEDTPVDIKRALDLRRTGG